MKSNVMRNFAQVPLPAFITPIIVTSGSDVAPNDQTSGSVSGARQPHTRMTGRGVFFNFWATLQMMQTLFPCLQSLGS